MTETRQQENARALWGIGEWYGRSFVQLNGKERRQYAAMQQLPKHERPVMPCLPRAMETTPPCTKEGGVCSLRLYQQRDVSGIVATDSSIPGILSTTCPYRFYEGKKIFRWIGETILETPNPLVIGQVRFLERGDRNNAESSGEPGREDVGRIDHVLVHPDTEHLFWCALEMQAVYFSGDSMTKDFRALANLASDALPLPYGRRHPDFRSSGPKRLMPQLQIKVPTLRRWGKKMCVLVDRMFFDSLGHMTEVSDVSNGDIAWFVVTYTEDTEGIHLHPDSVHLTTLENAVEGLTAGLPVSLPVFESQIRKKITGQLG